MKTEIKAYWTTKEVASYLRLNVKVVHRKVTTGEIKVKRFGKNLRFDPKHIKSLVK